MTFKSIDYFDHEADTGIVGRGATVDEAFVNAAKAVFKIMSASHFTPTEKIPITFEETDLEFALVTWLNLLIAQARAHQLIFSEFELHHKGSHWRGIAHGSQWKDLLRGTEVKGATLTELKVFKENNTWTAKCIVDV